MFALYLTATLHPLGLAFSPKPVTGEDSESWFGRHDTAAWLHISSHPVLVELTKTLFDESTSSENDFFKKHDLRLFPPV